MELDHLCQHVGGWLEHCGPSGDVVVSSRVRLARNVAGYLFYSHADSQQRAELLAHVRRQMMDLELPNPLHYMNLSDLSSVDRQMLFERHLISRQQAEAGDSKGVVWTEDETFSLMINEEDHLRLQVLSGGLQLTESFTCMDRLDDLLDTRLNYAFSTEYGYLTACPTNVGTGIRVSVMMHLPGLKIMGELEKVLRAAKELHLAVRGLYGEGSEPTGEFYQISNQVTLGKTESQIVQELIDLAVQPIVEYERRARQKLLEDKETVLEDKIFRARGILSNARMISTEETLYLLSYLRLGIFLGRIKDVPLDTVNRLFLLTQPAHLQKIYKMEMDPQMRDEIRAEYIRKHLT